MPPRNVELIAQIQAIEELVNKVASEGMSYSRPQGATAAGSAELLARARAEIQKLASFGERSASEELRLQSLRLREIQLQRRVERDVAGPGAGERFGEFGNVVQQFASLSGIGARGFFQLQAVTELGAMLGRVNPALLGATAAIGVLASAATGAAQRLNVLGAGMAQTGGSGGQIGALGSLFGALGMDAGGVAGVARQLREQVPAGGLGAAAGSALGLGFRPVGVGTPPNEARMLLDAIHGLRAMSPEQARLTAERLPSLAPFLQLRDALPETIERLESMASEMDRLASPEARASAMEFNLQMQQLKLTFDELVVGVGSKVLPSINLFLESLQGTMKDWTWNPFSAEFWRLGGDEKGRGSKGGKSAQDANTEAMERNTQAIEIFNKGIYGGGRRARRAIPGGIGDALDERARRDARLGAF